MTATPAFSVLLPVYAGDDATQFRRAARSVTADQTLAPDELVVVQDGPVPPELAEAIAELVATEGLRVVHEELPANRGLAEALTAGLAACANDVIARMDADDVSLPERFARQLPLLAAGADLVGSGMYEFAEDDTILAQRTPPTGRERIAAYARFHDPFNHPTVVYRRSVVDAAGGYLDLPLMEDYWLFARMIQAGAATENLADPLVMYRVDAGSYARRGGLRLFRSELRLQAQFRRSGFTSRPQWLRNVAIRGGYRFVPVALRRLVYQRTLAKRRPF